MTARDLDGVLAIAGDSVEAPQWSLKDYERVLLSDPAAPFGRSGLAAEWNGDLAGFAVLSLSRVERLAELETIVVHPRFRRRGIGARLLLACKDAAHRAGAAVMRLEVRESNKAALDLYLAQGFQKAGRRRSYYSAPIEDALVLQGFLQEPPEPSGLRNSIQPKG